MNLRNDLQLIYDWVPAGSHVLDLGCGKGELLHALMNEKTVQAMAWKLTATAFRQPLSMV